MQTFSKSILRDLENFETLQIHIVHQYMYFVAKVEVQTQSSKIHRNITKLVNDLGQRQYNNDLGIM